MAQQKIVKKVDELGRIAIPEEYCRMLGITKHDAFFIALRDDGAIQLTPVKAEVCPLCD